jgi:hypothetical protein
MKSDHIKRMITLTGENIKRLSLYIHELMKILHDCFQELKIQFTVLTITIALNIRIESFSVIPFRQTS